MYKRFFSIVMTVFFLFVLFPFSVSAEDEVNLARNVSCIVEISEPVSFSYGLLSDGGDPFETNNGRLTDENVASTDARSNAWYRAYRGGSRIVRFDFQEQVSVSGISAGFLFDSSRNICPPRYIKVYLSDDGIDYGLAAEYNAVYPLTYVSPEHCDIRLDFEENFSARYVNVEFSCDNYVYCDEISVFGSESLSGTEAKVQITEIEDTPKQFPSDISGAKDIIRLRTGGFSASEARAYIGYLNTNGEISGVMFDSVCLSPADDNMDFSDISAWDSYFSNLMSSWDVLQSAADEVYDKMDLDDKLKLFIVLPYPPVGEGRDMESRMGILKEFIDRCSIHFSDNAYEDIRLCGFFWGTNEMDFNASSHEVLLVKNTNEYIRQNDLSSVYETGYLAAGYDMWKELGFDCAIMSADHSSNRYFDIRMLSEFSESALKHNLGVSIKLDDMSYFSDDGFRKAGTSYESHLYYGYKTGYMNGITSYCGYENIFNYLCNADINTPKGIYLRRLYDLTYNFIHRTYENLAPQLELQTSHELHSGDSGITIDINIIDGDSYWNDITVEFPVMPKYGNVVASANKKELIYNVDEGFVGEDSFAVRVTDGFGYSAEQVVYVSVKEPTPVEPFPNESSDVGISAPDNGNSSDNSADDPHKTYKSPLLSVICIIAVAAGCAIVAGIGILAKKRKQ